MKLEPGDVIISRGARATFQIHFNEEGGWWWPCNLGSGNVWLVLDVERLDPQSDRITAKVLSITDLDCKPWWIEGSFDEWCTLDKLG